MLLETIIGGGVICYGLRHLVGIKLELKPYNIAETLGRARKTATNAIDAIRRQMVSRTAWEESRARNRAQDLYDKTVADIFAAATDDEKQTILALFAKYAPAEE